MKKNKGRNIVTWVIQVLMGLQFILAGQAKFTAAEAWSQKFTEWGYPDSFYLVVGLLELAGGILIFIPKFASKAAIGLAVIMIGATFTHLFNGEADRIIVTLILTGLLGLVYYLRKSESAPVKINA